MDQPTILRHASELQRATTLAALMAVTERAVGELTRYRHFWLGIFEPDGSPFIRVLDASTSQKKAAAELSDLVPTEGDQMVAEIKAGRSVVVVVDAETDPRTNKDMVKLFKNRTIINVPMMLGDTLIGALGVGTFGDEGVLAPTTAETDSLTIFGMQLAAAYNRVGTFNQQQRLESERRRLERQLEALERVELMGVLASGVAHDLNNFLTVVLSNLGTLQVAPTDREALADSIEAAKRSRDVVSQLLSLGRSQTNREWVDVNGRLRSTLALVRSSIPSGVTVHHDESPASLVEADPIQLDQAFANLIINARDAVGMRGMITLKVDGVRLDEATVRNAPWARAGTFTRVCVNDTGPGIDPVVLERMYDPLFTTKPDGTGLGLAVVSRVVRQHDGLLNCRSVLGKGTTFEVYLPAVG
jgi:signal transduction histidine kinase